MCSLCQERVEASLQGASEYSSENVALVLRPRTGWLCRHVRGGFHAPGVKCASVQAQESAGLIQGPRGVKQVGQGQDTQSGQEVGSRAGESLQTCGAPPEGHKARRSYGVNDGMAGSTGTRSLACRITLHTYELLFNYVSMLL